MIPIKGSFTSISVANQILSADSNHHLLLLSFLDAVAYHHILIIITKFNLNT